MNEISARLADATPEEREQYRRILTGEADNDIIRLSVLRDICRELRLGLGRSPECQRVLGEVMRAALKRREIA